MDDYRRYQGDEPTGPQLFPSHHASHVEPGWYADPAGPPSQLRWWDGSQWADRVATAGADRRAAARKSRRLWPALVSCVAVGLVVVLLVGIVGTRLLERDGGSSGKPRVTSGSISYTQLGGSWGAPAATDRDQLFTPGRGQKQLAEKLTGEDLYAEVAVGKLADSVYVESGPTGLQKTATNFAKSVEIEHALADPTRKDLVKKPLKVSGRDAYQINYHLDFAESSGDDLDVDGTTVYTVVVDDGLKPSVMAVTVPDNKQELHDDAESVIRSLKVG